MVVPVGIALGSNLGNRPAELDAAVAFLRGLSANGQVFESVRIETEPVDCPAGSPPFLNAVVEMAIDSRQLSPEVLLTRLQAFEQARGRAPSHERNTPRPLDLDILYYGDLVVREAHLVIPHPRATERRFVLEPLQDIRPELVLPGQTKTVRELFQSVVI